MLEICPSCNEQVVYEVKEDGKFCPNCGWEQNAAKRKVVSERKRANSDKIWNILKWIGIVLLVIYILLKLIINPAATLAGWFVHLIGMLPIVAAIIFFNRKNKVANSSIANNVVEINECKACNDPSKFEQKGDVLICPLCGAVKK